MRRIFHKATLVFFVALLACCLCLQAEAQTPSARKVSLEDCASGDQIVIHHPASGFLMSRYKSSRYYAPIHVQLSDDGQVISQVPRDACVLTLEFQEEGSLLLKGQEGYLSVNKEGKHLIFSEEKTEFCFWKPDGQFLTNLHAPGKHGQPGSVCLEYYNGSFSPYAKEAGSEPTSFALAFYRLESPMPPDQEGYYLPVFETSDVHGYLLDLNQQPRQHPLAYISDKVRDARSRSGEFDKDHAILVDSGDIYQGNVVSDYLDGMPLSRAYELMEYDAVGVGNHEFDWGIENTIEEDATMIPYIVDGQVYPNDIPVVNCNIFQDGEKVSFARDYVILEKQALDAHGDPLDVRVAVIGFAENYSLTIMNTNFLGLGMSILEDYDLVNRMAADLEERGLCQATILLCHGESLDIARGLGPDTPVDLVLGGHSHDIYCRETNWGLPFAQPNSNARSFVSAQLIFDKDERGQAVLRDVGHVQTVSINDDPSLLHDTPENAHELDREIVSLSHQVDHLVDARFSRQIGYITADVLRYTPIGDNPRSNTAANWMTHILMRAAGAQVAFTNRGSLRLDFPLPQGQHQRAITVSDVYAMFPFSNFIYLYEITYGQLLEIIEFSLNRGEGLYTHINGIDCYYSGNRVNALVMDGRALYRDGQWSQGWEDRTLRVAVMEYVAAAAHPDNLLNRLRDTPQLLSARLVDNESAVEVLTEEAARNGGLLHVDPLPHMILGDYPSGASQ